MAESLRLDSKKGLGLSDIADTNLLNQRLLMGDIDPNSIGLKRMTGRIFETMKDSLEGFAGGFGLGFPYHSMDENGRTIPNPEFARYTGILAERLESEIASESSWPCISCQNGPSFKPDNCKTCPLTTLKPRDIMKALPDIDTFVIMDEVTPEVLGSVWSLAQERGFTQSDFSVADSTIRVNSVLQDFESEIEPKIFLPVDLHILSKQDFLDACRDVGAGRTDVKAKIWSMYADWKLNEDLDFWFDFVFSATPYRDTMQADVYEAVVEARRQMGLRLTNQSVIDTITQKSDRANRLLGNVATGVAFNRKLDEWRA